MKKIIALAMALALALSFTPALSEEEENTIELDRLNKTGNTTVTMTVDSARDSYIVVIPSTVEIDPVTQYGEAAITLKSGWVLISVNGLDVKLTGAENGIGAGVYNINLPYPVTHSSYQNFKMKSASEDFVTYAIKPSNFSAPMHSMNNNNNYLGYYLDSLISVDKGGDNTEDQTCTLTFYVATMPPEGVYTDTLTFTISTR